MFIRKPACDWLIVGLGNPGANYARTRHNVGFRAVDAIAENCNVKINRAKFRGLTAAASWRGQRLLLLKPQTFMNNSGLSVAEAARFYKLPPERIIVLFDDISLDIGRLRIRAEGSAGGHNGIKSIIGMLNTQSFPRVKIGVGAKPHPDYDLADWVLSDFTAREQRDIDDAVSRAASAALAIAERGTYEAANLYNGG
ncbi:MAG: aminoacyl-tRNA hydrolase [Oscillospiraceae bacterium]|jgi:PTH1 family peptidyl-tRNA hydrolase|nr:aminoacyl-tRNA hydrolase [Oscillospiraceae bacterium]